MAIAARGQFRQTTCSTPYSRPRDRPFASNRRGLEEEPTTTERLYRLEGRLDKQATAINGLCAQFVEHERIMSERFQTLKVLARFSYSVCSCVLPLIMQMDMCRIITPIHSKRIFLLFPSTLS